MTLLLNNNLEIGGVVNVVESVQRNLAYEELCSMKCVSIFFSKSCDKSLDELYTIFNDSTNYNTISINGSELDKYDSLIEACMLIPEEGGAIKKITLKRSED